MINVGQSNIPITAANVTSQTMINASAVLMADTQFTAPSNAILAAYVRANRAMTAALGWRATSSTGASAGEWKIGADPPSMGRVMKSQGMDFIAQYKMQASTSAVVFATVNYWATNHHTGGAKLPVAQLKAVRTILSLDSATSDADITAAVYLAGHVADKRIVLQALLPTGIASSLVTVSTVIPSAYPSLDIWTDLRTKALTSGTGLPSLSSRS